MKTFIQVSTLQKFLTHKRDKGKTIALVPTMGALHDGHLTLIKNALSVADIVVCSIFVNPTQFNKADDLKKYPRQQKKDAALLKSVGCHVLFAPNVKQVYPSDFVRNEANLGKLAQVMEGANRPGHFEGVVEVVSRLFDIVEPNKALFGEKDFQQLAVLRKMTEELDYNIEILGVPIVREKSGLAMSSRNQRLSKKGKIQAAFIFKTLSELSGNYASLTPNTVKSVIKDKFEKESTLELEYFELGDNRLLQPIKNWKGPDGVRAFIGAWIDGVRLIDNMELIPAKR
ncbi:MAG: pantoate--beta-alanine ligase [Patiriisocius sp.]|jgi:pantoate--beta-alanine ligase